MASNQVPEKLINFRVYLEGNYLAGVADVELPKLEGMSESVTGAGIAGEVDSPVIGHYKAMKTTVKFRTITAEAVGILAAPAAHLIDFRGSQQIQEAGVLKSIPIRVTIKGTPTSVELGKLEVGKPTDSGDEFSVSYLKVYVDGKEIVEIDPYNFIAKFNGVDALAGVRKDLGL